MYYLTLHQVWHNHSTYSSSKVSNEPKLCCTSQTRFGQTFKCKLHCLDGGSQLVIANCHGIEKKWFNVVTKKDPYPLPFIEVVLEEIVGHEV